MRKPVLMVGGRADLVSADVGWDAFGMYRERASRLPGSIVWQKTVPAVAGDDRVLPDGCMDLIWVDGELLVAGPDTRAHLDGAAPGARYVALRFAPGTGPAVLGVPAHELRDRRVPLADLWPGAQVRRLAGAVEGAPDRGGALECAAAARLESPDPAIAQIVARLRGGATVADTAQRVGLGERQLRRRCLYAFGYGPKTLVRILRMNRAVALSCAGTPFSAVAATAGYADQAHLAREVKALAGVPLGVLVNSAV